MTTLIKGPVAPDHSDLLRDTPSLINELKALLRKLGGEDCGDQHPSEVARVKEIVEQLIWRFALARAKKPPRILTGEYAEPDHGYARLACVKSQPTFTDNPDLSIPARLVAIRRESPRTFEVHLPPTWIMEVRQAAEARIAAGLRKSLRPITLAVGNPT